MRICTFGGILAASVLLCGCATIVRGRHQDLTIESMPSNANVRLSTGQTCVTPCTISVKRKSKFFVEISKDGYQTQEVAVHGVVKGGGAAGGAGNAILGGPLGLGVDAWSGAMMNLSPNPVKVTLVPGQGSAQGGGK